MACCLRWASSLPPAIPSTTGGFHSGIYGIIGCLLMVAAYCGFNWDKLKVHDHHARVILGWLVGITTFIIILDIAEAILA